jgi:hypothetical protein
MFAGGTVYEVLNFRSFVKFPLDNRGKARRVC